MNKKLIVDVNYLITLVGAAPLLPQLVETAKSIAPTAIAADGGAESALSIEWMPDVVIGDIDSLPDQLQAQLPEAIIHRVAEQDTTDFEKCLSRVAAPLILGVGFLGGRVDHTLANFHALLQFADQRCILFDETDAVFLLPPELSITLPLGCRFSLFPLFETTVGAQGLEWSFSALSMVPGVQIGTSNWVTGPVAVSADAPGVLCIVPSSEIMAVVQAILNAPQSWPVR